VVDEGKAGSGATRSAVPPPGFQQVRRAPRSPPSFASPKRGIGPYHDLSVIGVTFRPGWSFGLVVIGGPPGSMDETNFSGCPEGAQPGPYRSPEETLTRMNTRTAGSSMGERSALKLHPLCDLTRVGGFWAEPSGRCSECSGVCRELPRGPGFAWRLSGFLGKTGRARPARARLTFASSLPDPPSAGSTLRRR
jgi:hypothetical protein